MDKKQDAMELLASFPNLKSVPSGNSFAPTIIFENFSPEQIEAIRIFYESHAKSDLAEFLPMLLRGIEEEIVSFVISDDGQSIEFILASK